MAYLRVIPRDLFNEAGLLKCYGRLWILLDELHHHDAHLSEGDGAPFLIEQDDGDGSITVASLPFRVNGNAWRLARPLNSRRPWPLYARRHDEEVEVFTEDGQFTLEFERLVGAHARLQTDDDRCTSPGGHVWVTQEGDDIAGEGRSYCEQCGADGDA